MSQESINKILNGAKLYTKLNGQQRAAVASWVTTQCQNNLTGAVVDVSVRMHNGERRFWVALDNGRSFAVNHIADNPRRTVIFPADVKLAFPEGSWQRLSDGRIKARLTLPEMRLVNAWGRMLRGDDVTDGDLLPQWAVA